MKKRIDREAELRLIGAAAETLVKAGYKIQVRDGERFWCGEQTQSVADVQSACSDNETGESWLFVYQPHVGDLDNHVGWLLFFHGCGNDAFSHVKAACGHFDRIGAALHNAGMYVDARGISIPEPNAA
jgi:hypothetical protein